MSTAPPKGDTSGMGHRLHVAVWRRLHLAAGAGRYIRTCWRLKSLNNQREPDKANKLIRFFLCGNKYQDSALKPCFFLWLHIFPPALISYRSRDAVSISFRVQALQEAGAFSFYPLAKCSAYLWCSRNNEQQQLYATHMVTWTGFWLQEYYLKH